MEVDDEDDVEIDEEEDDEWFFLGFIRFFEVC